MTLTDLRALHAIIADALDDVATVYSPNHSYPDDPDPSRSPSPTSSTSSYYTTSTSSRPSSPSYSQYNSPATPYSPTYSAFPPLSAALDFPALNLPYDPSSPSEKLTSHPVVASAIKRIVAACGQMAVTVQAPFLTLCDAAMGYHLPSCLRFLEASHTIEILRDAGQNGMHVHEIASRNGVDPAKLSHILRLLATHHVLTEVSPDVFASNRISTPIDSGKPWSELVAHPQSKYDGVSGKGSSGSSSNKGVGAFVAMCTDELFKASAYMTDTFLPVGVDSIAPTGNVTTTGVSEEDTTRKVHRMVDGGVRQLAAKDTPTGSTGDAMNGQGGGCQGRVRLGEHFGLAGGVGALPDMVSVEGRGSSQVLAKPTRTPHNQHPHPSLPRVSDHSHSHSNLPTHSPFNTAFDTPKEFFAWLEEPGNEGRMRRFAVGMVGSSGWEDRDGEGYVRGGVLAFPWDELPDGSLVIDVGGGIGSTSMVLARRFAGLKVVVQDRVGVVRMGVEAWRERAPDLLDSGRVVFQAHDFFTPQPTLPGKVAVFLLRVITHDWPDEYARRILLCLRRAACVGDEEGGGVVTRLVLGEHVLPLACEVDGGSGDEDGLVERRLPSWRAPLLSNLGKASANGYWMDLTMRCMFNSQERTLGEMVALAASAGWQVVKVGRAEGSLFGCVVAVPCAVPVETLEAEGRREEMERARAAEEVKGPGLSKSPSMGDTFGSRVGLPEVLEGEGEARRRSALKRSKSRRRKVVSCLM